MSKLTRREFFGRSALGIGSVLLAKSLPLEAFAARPAEKRPLGFQVWTVNSDLQKDFAGTLKKVAAMDYQYVEMCSPPGYGWVSLSKMKPAEMKKIVEDSGLKLVSTHYGFDELKKNLDERMQFASESGQKQMIVSTFGLNEKATLSDWMKACDDLNKIGEKTKKNGIQTGYHNHDGEVGTVDGKLIYDELMKELDPANVKMQFQVAVIRLGFKAADFFKKYPGRFLSAHIADWSPTDKKTVPAGKGIVDWKEFFEAAKTGGVQNFFVEMDPVTFKDSAAYLHSI